MRRIKLLITTGDFSRWVSPHFHYLLEELARITDLTIWHKSGDIRDIVKQLSLQPDFILINEYGEKNSPKISGLQSLTIPFGVYLHDLHYDIEQRKKALMNDKVQHIFSYYRDKFLHWFPELSDRLRWLPHHVNTTEVYKDYGLKKEIDWLLMGATYSCYPLRNQMIKEMEGKPGFVYHRHPGYRNYNEKDQEHFIGQRYAMEMNRAKMFLTCDSIFHYPLRKYYEVLACNTLLLAPSSNELRDLGFIPGVHFAGVSEADFLDKAEYYLTHESERKEIAKMGYDMVQSTHSTVKRAEQLVGMLRDIL
ncbi:glycosyltransferase [Paenibacillus thalictri]|uniref:Glycosyltransferase family 1 protein n=1 Tax=Paenibacillus thalictri TaxID=2527873 RepID=A0A4Q9DTU6_9BACL|nr:glycosyltransferase [Paenibacillus thalictri]TBL78637.1 glycosyltransferase family 1 protein [Paenibacillus thalictri]